MIAEGCEFVFTERLNELFKLLGASSADIARCMRCDRSNVSRICKGQRIPRSGGACAAGLVKGIYGFADERGLTVKLCTYISCFDYHSAAEVERRLLSWLYEGEAENGALSKQRKEKISHRSFGQKLSAVMELADLSNIRLGRAINIDPSYISRFRNGFRSPRSNKNTMDNICIALLDHLQDEGKMRRLARIMSVPPEQLDSREDAFFLLGKWLFSVDDDQSPTLEKLIDRIDSISDLSALPDELLHSPEQYDQPEEKSIFFGSKGLRNASILFLTEALKTDSDALYLYSEQSMSWISGDHAFYQQWLSLMAACVRRGMKIHIIHNTVLVTGAPTTEINTWFPLYHSGLITSYYCRRQRSSRISSTVFLCPGRAAVSGHNVIGCEEEYGVYRYDTDKEILAAFKNEFDGLISFSDRLVQVYKTSDIDKLMPVGRGGFTVLGSTLPLASMSDGTIEEILDRNKIDKSSREEIMSILQHRRTVVKNNLNDGYVHDCVPIADPEALKNGRAIIDLPQLSCFYTPEEYAEHLKNILSLCEKYPNYRFYALPVSPFVNVLMFISKNAVAVCRLKAPYITFFFTHPTLCSAFMTYAEKVKLLYGCDKLTLKKKLEQYFPSGN